MSRLLPESPAAEPEPCPLTARELAVVALAACLVAVLMHWPLVLHLGDDIPKDLGDPLIQAWQLAWGGHALLHQPLDYFQANTFWPLENTLAFSEALVGYAPAGLVGRGPHAAVVRYDLVFLFAYALCLVGAYLLARELGVGRTGAAVAGVAFAYAPWRLEQDGHLHVLSSGGIPLSLFLLVRGYRRGRPGTALAGWLVASWQLSLGFTLGLQLAYLLAGLALVSVLLWRRGALRLDRAMLVASTGGAAVFAATALVLAQPYLEVRDDHRESRRTPARVSAHSGPVRSFLAAPEQNLVWGEATSGVRDDLSFVPEQTLFPGAVILMLAVGGAIGGAYPRRLRIALAAAAAGFAWLSLGFHEGDSVLLRPYRLVYDLAPGWDAIRVPGRLTTLTSLALALLAAAGAHQLIGRLGRRRGGLAASLAAVVLPAAILVEGSGFDVGKDGALLSGPPHPAVPQPPPGIRGIPEPQVHLPLYVYRSRRFVLWSTDGFPKLVNGRGSFRPRLIAELNRELAPFPDRYSVASLRALEVRSVVLHPQLVAGTAWAGWRARAVRGLPVERRPRGGVVVYELAPR